LTPNKKNRPAARGTRKKAESSPPKEPTNPAAARSVQKKGKLGDPARTHAIVTDVTEEEKQEIIKHCLEKRQSVSQYLAQLALADMEKGESNEEGGEEQITLTFTAPEMRKLRMMARISQSSVSEIIFDSLSARLKYKRLHGSLQPDLLRFYVTPEEHERIKKHIASKGMSARNYIALLALEEALQRLSTNGRDCSSLAKT
jgi:hypothetical protein